MKPYLIGIYTPQHEGKLILSEIIRCLTYAELVHVSKERAQDVMRLRTGTSLPLEIESDIHEGSDTRN